MGIVIKPSDLQYRYPRKKENLNLPKFSGKPDPAPFDRYDLYEIIPMFEAVMDTLGSADGGVLNRMEEVLDKDIPSFIESREEVYDCLVEVMGDILAEAQGGRG